ncbi:MAG: ATP-dependent helicase [bacterium]
MRKYTLKSETPKARPEPDYLKALNPQQRTVVTAPPGPSLVIAGAGSGKTHTLTHRVVWLLDQGVSADRVLLLTFTNKAARNMTDRVAALIQTDARRIWSGTFHSIGNRILRQHAGRLGYPEAFTILDTEDSGTLLKACIATVTDEYLQKRFPRGNVMAAILSKCINTQRTVADVLDAEYPQFSALAEPVRDAFHLYQSRKLEMGLMDFDDLLLNWKRLLVEFEDVRGQLTQRFEHILVDEYQDTNHLQGEVVDLMASGHGNLMVVGDDCQSIYRFRGAEYRNILEFPQRHTGTRLYKLETNYRSTPQVLTLTNASIAHNPHQFPKTLEAARPDGPKPALVQVADVYQQAEFVCQRLLELCDEGVSLNEIAVLYRSHHHSMELQVEMGKRGIPFVVRSGVRFFEQAHIKDVLAYLKFIFNPKDELSFLRLAQHFPGIGTQRAKQLHDVISSAGDPLAAATSWDMSEQLPPRSRAGWDAARELLGTLKRRRLSAPPSELVDAVRTGPYRDYMERTFEDQFDNRMGDLEQLANYAAQFEDLDRFLGELSLMSSVSGQDILVGGQTPDEYVTLSSIHQAKGLEWSAVFVLWLSDGHFPSASSMAETDGLKRKSDGCFMWPPRGQKTSCTSTTCIVSSHATGGHPSS